MLQASNSEAALHVYVHIYVCIYAPNTYPKVEQIMSSVFSCQRLSHRENGGTSPVDIGLESELSV